MESSIFVGNKHEVTLPTGRVVLIRETNGDDDEILSKVKDAASGDNVINFLANITENDSFLGKKPLASDVENWPISDKYYLLFKQRMINIGETLSFQHICQNPDCPNHKAKLKVDWDQDLNEFDGDLTLPIQEYKVKDNVVKKYPFGNSLEVEFTTKSGHQFKYKVMNTTLERRRFTMSPDNLSNNLPLLLRDISVKAEMGWVRLTHFKSIPSKVMVEIRNHIVKNDPLFDPKIKFECPVCSEPYIVPLLQVPNFFMPTE